ncbi:hypothetical protein ACH4E8_34455 [Streptomyces sp. NPDC017979]|uniref:hypothetical protein n=1 Tax=Streptomyces sp. NPDC017979 TaxID=3365024 RepID=UPI0037ADFBC6
MVKRTNEITELLRTIDRNYAVAFLAVVLYNASNERIAEELQIPLDEVPRLCSLGASFLRHPSRSMHVRESMSDADDGMLVIDAGLRALLREWRMEEKFAALCVQCRRPMDATWNKLQRTGRPRRFCSGACRQKAYRERRRPDA